jgi:hypothetical protein
MKRSFLEIHSSTHTNSERVPHVRTSVRGLIKTGRSPSKVFLFLFSVPGFLLRKAHTRSCPELRTGNSGPLARFSRDVGYRRTPPQACDEPHRSARVPQRKWGEAHHSLSIRTRLFIRTRAKHSGRTFASQQITTEAVPFQERILIPALYSPHRYHSGEATRILSSREPPSAPASKLCLSSSDLAPALASSLIPSHPLAPHTTRSPAGPSSDLELQTAK